MFDNLRQQMTDNSEAETSIQRGQGGSPFNLGVLGGLTPIQRFVLALMLFLNVSVLGCLALVVVGRIALPF